MLENYGLILDKFFNHYLEGDAKNKLVSAKELYLSQTGQVDEDSPFYEVKMDAFNEWFLFNFRPESSSQDSLVNDFLKRSPDVTTKDFAEALLQPIYSLFEYSRNTLSGQMVLLDLLTNQKIILAPDHDKCGLYKGDLFVCRLIKYQGHFYLLKSMFTIPQIVHSVVKKQATLVRKKKVAMTNENFLFKVEAMKSKSITYSHIAADKFFIFE